jgi:hypothetical protein
VRVLVAEPGPSFSVQDCFTGWCEGLEQAGAQVVRYNLSDRLTFYGNAHVKLDDGSYVKSLSDTDAIRLAANGLLSACYQTMPDVVLVVSAFFLPLGILDLIRAHGTKVVVLHTESPYEDDRQLTVAAHADLNLLNDPTNLDRFTDVAPALYMPHAYRPGFHARRPAQPELKSDFAFVGTGYASRIAFLEAVDWTGLDVLLAGNWQPLTDGSPLRAFVAHDIDECVDNTQALDIYSATKVGANLYRREAERPELAAGWAMGPREVEMAAAGVFFLRDPRGESDEVLGMLPTFTDPEDFGEQVRWWARHDDEREALATRAQAAVADRTFVTHAKRLLASL